MRFQRLLLSPNVGEGGTETPEPSKGGTADPAAAFQALLDKKNGDANALAFLLWNENHDLRGKNRDLNARLPKDDSVVLSGDDAKAWNGLRALGPADDVKRMVREHAELSGFKARAEREQSLAEVAEKAGVTNLKAFLRVAGDARFEVKAEKVDGKDVPRVFVKDGDAEVPFDQHFADFLPSIRPEPTKPEGPKGTPERSPFAPPPAADSAPASRRPLTYF